MVNFLVNVVILIHHQKCLRPRTLRRCIARAQIIRWPRLNRTVRSLGHGLGFKGRSARRRVVVHKLCTCTCTQWREKRNNKAGIRLYLFANSRKMTMLLNLNRLSRRCSVMCTYCYTRYVCCENLCRSRKYGLISTSL